VRGPARQTRRLPANAPVFGVILVSCGFAWGGAARGGAVHGDVTDAVFRMGVGAGAVAAAAIIGRLTFWHEIELPRVPPEPAPTPEVVAQAVATVASAVAAEQDPDVYAEQLASDSRALHIDPPVTPADLSDVLPYRMEAARLKLEPGRKRATASILGLGLSLSVDDIPGTPRRQLVLTIDNTTRHHMAYRVSTRPSQGQSSCFAKRDLAHNAIALAPGEKVRRSECIYRKGLVLHVDRVETIRLSRLSYYYVSALPQAALGFDRPDRLAARGHLPASARSPCRVFQSAELIAAVSSGSASWRDVVDFYARHPCGVYSFKNNYKAFDRPGERALPAVSAGL
jgi:hypothetical protein